MIKILVTGSNGQLGTEIRNRKDLVKTACFEFVDVDTLDLRRTGELGLFFEARSFDYIINCAAYTAVDKAESEELMASGGNVGVVENLVRHARPSGSKFIHISTDYVFDGSSKTPYQETDPPKPQTIYGSTKLKGEQLVLNYPAGMIIRTSWLYSPFGHNFLKSILSKAKQGNDLRVVDDQIGTPTYAGHLANAILDIINSVENDSAFVHGIFHYSNMGSCTWFDFAAAIIREAGLKVNVIPIKTPEYQTAAKRPAYSVLSKEKIINTYSLTIPHWMDGLKECLKQV